MVASLILPAIHVDGLIAKNTTGFEITVPVITLSGTIITGRVVSGGVSVPAIKVLATIGHYNSLTFDLDLPEITTNLFIMGAQKITVQGAPLRKAFVVNLAHFGVTEYSGYSFNSFANYHFSKTYIGASEEGIFVLDGDDDNGVRINATIQPGNEDLWSQTIKRLREGFVTMRGGPISIELILDEGRLDPVTRDLEYVESTIHEERFKISRGLKNRFFSVIFKNLGGNDFSLESFRFFCDEIQRRKR